MASAKHIVVDLGREYLRGGFSGDVNPRCTLGHTVFAAEVPLRVYVNELFQNLFIHHLQVKPKQYNVLIVEKILVPRLVRDMLVSVLLRDFQVGPFAKHGPLLSPTLTTYISLRYWEYRCNPICLWASYLPEQCLVLF